MVRPIEMGSRQTTSSDSDLITLKAPRAKLLLLTGIPGIGKTTVIKKVVTSLPDLRVSGFYTEEIREHGVRQGFALVTVDGNRRVMAHTESFSAHRVGRYGVEIAAVDAAVRESLAAGEADLFIVDEIGRMECFSELFKQNVSSLLVSGTPLVATIARKGSGFIAAVKRRPGTEIWEVTRENRDDLPGKVVSWVRQRAA